MLHVEQKHLDETEAIVGDDLAIGLILLLSPLILLVSLARAEWAKFKDLSPRRYLRYTTSELFAATIGLTPAIVFSSFLLGQENGTLAQRIIKTLALGGLLAVYQIVGIFYQKIKSDIASHPEMAPRKESIISILLGATIGLASALVIPIIFAMSTLR